jgi:hypothetical protein
VFFADPDVMSDIPSQAFHVDYIDGSFKLVRMAAIQYRYDELSIYVGPEKEPRIREGANSHASEE